MRALHVGIILDCSAFLIVVAMLIRSLIAALGRGLIGRRSRGGRELMPKRKLSRFMTLVRRGFPTGAVQLRREPRKIPASGRRFVVAVFLHCVRAGRS